MVETTKYHIFSHSGQPQIVLRSQASQLTATVVSDLRKARVEVQGWSVMVFPKSDLFADMKPFPVQKRFSSPDNQPGEKRKLHYRLPHLWLSQSEFLVTKHSEHFIKEPEIKEALDWKPPLNSHCLANTNSKFNPQYPVVWGASMAVERKSEFDPQHLHTNARAGSTCSQSQC